MDDYFKQMKDIFSTKKLKEFLDNKNTEQIKEISGKMIEDASNNVNHYKDKISESYKDISAQAEKKLPEIKKSVNDTTRATIDAAKKVHNSVSQSRIHFEKASNAAFGFYKITKYSLIAAGAGVFLFGLGYVMRPIADIYSTNQAKKKEN